MKKRHWLSVLLVLLSAALASAAQAAVEWELQKTLELPEAPRAVAVAPDGRSTYVLTDSGEIVIFDASGALLDRFAAGGPFDDLALSPDGSTLFLTNRAAKSVQVVALDFIVDIDIEGSPVEGPASAPVAIVVFSDFQ